jgi:DNA topoisomerase III
MGKALIIAEKPSVAGDIARALGGFKRHEEYYESDQYVLSSAVGHLLELVVPEQYEVKRGKWTFAHLPIIPPHFDLQPIERTTGKLKVLTKLLRRKDVTSIINACDAGREGELIFRNLVKYVNVDKPIRRLWLQSMTQAAIREGFAAQRDDAALRPLADAATCRSEADWLVGINGTRAMTAFQFEDRRVPPHHRRPGPDPDPGDRGRARGTDQSIRAPGITRCTPRSPPPRVNIRAVGSMRHSPARRMAIPN